MHIETDVSIFEHTIILHLILAAENLEILNFSLLKYQFPSLCVFIGENSLF